MLLRRPLLALLLFSSVGLSGCESRATKIRFLVVTGLGGVLEPCGCTSRPLGGLDRMASVVRASRADDAPTALLLAGALWFDADPSDSPMEGHWQRNAEAVASLLRRLGVDAASLGMTDLARGHRRLARLREIGGFPLLCAGVRFDDDAGLERATEATAVLILGKERVGLVGAVQSRTEGSPPSVHFGVDPIKAIDRRVRELRSTGVTRVVLLAEGDRSFARALASRTAPDFVFLSNVEAGGIDVEAFGTTRIVQAGKHGESVAVIEQRADGRVDIGRVEIDEAVAPDDAIRAELARLTRKINEANQQALADLRPVPVPDGGSAYAGSEPCAACHTRAYLWWAQSPHGRAYASLASRDKEFNLDCVGCHVTGYGKPGGATVTHVEGLQNVGCESCHGPGAEHVANPRPPHRFVAARVAPEVCRACHDARHDDDFDHASASRSLLVLGHGL